MKAMVFSAGLGSRLGELTKHTPKCLLTAGGKTLLQHVIERLKAASVDTVIINLHYLHEQIRDYLSRQNNFGLNIHFSYEEQLLGTGGGLLHAKKFFSDNEDFLIYNSDIYCELELIKVIKQHKVSKNIATLCVMQRESSRYLYFDSTGLLANWNSKEAQGLPLGAIDPNHQRFAFSGIHLANTKIFQYLAMNQGNFSILRAYLQAMLDHKKVGFQDISSQFWVDIGTPANLSKLQSHLDSAH